MKLSVSILGLKDSVRDKIELLNKTSIDYFHLDIMDGKFVPNYTWDMPTLRSLRYTMRKPLDIHLMVSDVDSFIQTYLEFEPTMITFHLEATKDPLSVIQTIQSKGIKAGIAIKPNTPLEELFPYLEYVDLILVMSVEPGRGGQSYIEGTEDKIDSLTYLRDTHEYHYMVSVDGGINAQTVQLVKEANVDMIVVGSFITNHSDYQSQIDQLQIEN